MEYEIVKTFQGYQISKPYGRFNLYIAKVCKGRYEWVTDHTYAKHFSLKTVIKHVEILKRIEMKMK